MDIKTKRNGITNQTIAMFAVIVVLTGGFAYYYGQVSSLKQAGSTVCQQALSLATAAEALVSNSTLTLQSQIKGDNSLIQTLNSTRPAGYTDMLTTLKTQVAQDLALITYYESLSTTAVVPASSLNPCLSFE